MRKIPLISLSLFLSLLLHTIILADNISFYIKEEIGTDNNIYEANQNPASALINQLWGGIKYQNKYDQHFIALRSKTNYSLYIDHSQENKFVEVLDINHLYRLNNILLNTSINGFFKKWTGLNRGYNDLGLTESVIWKSRPIGVQFSTSVNSMKYRNYKLFNNDNFLLALRFNFRSHQDYLYFLSFSEQYAIFPESEFYIDSLNIYQDKKRYDNNFIIRSGIEYSKRFIMGSTITYCYNQSNYDYFNNHCLNLKFYGSWKIKDLLLQLIMQTQFKKYNNPPTNENVIYDPDPEQNQENKIMLGLEIPFDEKISLTSKLAWYHNESTFISQYYDKIMATLGFQYNFK